MGGGGGGGVKETQDQQEMARIAAERYNLYQANYVPLEEFYKKKVFESRSPAAYETVRGLAGAEYSDKFAPAMEERDLGLAAKGINPSSGAFKSPAMEKAYAESAGRGIAGAEVGNTNRFYRGLEGVIQMGQGQSSSAMEGLIETSNRSGENAAAAARSAFEGGSLVNDVAGTVAGAGYGYALNKKG